MANESHSHPFGEPVNILKFGEGNKVIVDDAALDKMFLHHEVKNRKIVVFSIIGALRRGKSFFLDYCLRYLYAHVSSVSLFFIFESSIYVSSIRQLTIREMRKLIGVIGSAHQMNRCKDSHGDQELVVRQLELQCGPTCFFTLRQRPERKLQS